VAGVITSTGAGVVGVVVSTSVTGGLGVLSPGVNGVNGGGWVRSTLVTGGRGVLSPGTKGLNGSSVSLGARTSMVPSSV
jgi:hypothetical protein